MNGHGEVSQLSKLSDILSSPMTTVTVGPLETNRSFHVHERLLTTSSTFFAKALSGDWIEARSRTVSLPEEDPLYFGFYLKHLYSYDGRIDIDPAPTRPTDYVTLLDLFAMGTRLEAFEFKERIFHILASRWRDICDLSDEFHIHLLEVYFGKLSDFDRGYMFSLVPICVIFNAERFQRLLFYPPFVDLLQKYEDMGLEMQAVQQSIPQNPAIAWDEMFRFGQIPLQRRFLGESIFDEGVREQDHIE